MLQTSKYVAIHLDWGMLEKSLLRQGQFLLKLLLENEQGGYLGPQICEFVNLQVDVELLVSLLYTVIIDGISGKGLLLKAGMYSVFSDVNIEEKYIARNLPEQFTFNSYMWPDLRPDLWFLLCHALHKWMALTFWCYWKPKVWWSLECIGLNFCSHRSARHILIAEFLFPVSNHFWQCNQPTSLLCLEDQYM